MKCLGLVRQLNDLYFKNPPQRILDLGAGIVAKNGAHVTAIDNSKKLLQIFSSQCLAEGCPNENIRLRHGDITTMKSYGENFEVVVAVDTLPYIPPKYLHSTMEKIQKCLVDKGILLELFSQLTIVLSIR